MTGLQATVATALAVVAAMTVPVTTLQVSIFLPGIRRRRAPTIKSKQLSVLILTGILQVRARLMRFLIVGFGLLLFRFNGCPGYVFAYLLFPRNPHPHADMLCYL